MATIDYKNGAVARPGERPPGPLTDGARESAAVERSEADDDEAGEA